MYRPHALPHIHEPQAKLVGLDLLEIEADAAVMDR
jgi:hypothetical protein